MCVNIRCKKRHDDWACCIKSQNDYFERTTLISRHHNNRETNWAQELLDCIVYNRWRMLNYDVTVIELLLHCQCHYKAQSCSLVLFVSAEWLQHATSMSQHYLSYGSYVNPFKHSRCPSIQDIPRIQINQPTRCNNFSSLLLDLTLLVPMCSIIK
jgi:hypothetical protein